MFFLELGHISAHKLLSSSRDMCEVITTNASLTSTSSSVDFRENHTVCEEPVDFQADRIPLGRVSGNGEKVSSTYPFHQVDSPELCI